MDLTIKLSKRDAQYLYGLAARRVLAVRTQMKARTAAGVRQNRALIAELEACARLEAALISAIESRSRTK